MQFSAFVSLLLIATTFAYPVTQNLQHNRSNTNGLLDINASSNDSGSVLEISGHDVDAYKDVHKLIHRDESDNESVETLPKPAGSAKLQMNLNKSMKKELIAYLANIPPGGVEVQFVPKQWRRWHGDNKSQASSKSTKRTFHTESFTDGLTKWDTRVLLGPEEYALYESPKKEDAQTIISALISASL